MATDKPILSIAVQQPELETSAVAPATEALLSFQNLLPGEAIEPYLCLPAPQPLGAVHRLSSGSSRCLLHSSSPTPGALPAEAAASRRLLSYSLLLPSLTNPLVRSSSRQAAALGLATPFPAHLHWALLGATGRQPRSWLQIHNPCQNSSWCLLPTPGN